VTQNDYLSDHQWVSELERSRALELLLDPKTIRPLQEIWVSEKWCCLEARAVGGSIAEWLCQTVRTDGQAPAADSRVKFFKELDCSNRDVSEFNLITDELPEAAFDLVHVRPAPIHLPQMEEMLR